MQYSKENLFKRSIREFEDKKNNCLVWRTERVITESGYQFIIKQKEPRAIAAAIHTTQDFEHKEVGKIEVSSVMINTREELDPNDLIEYENQYFAIESRDYLNETMGMYHYICFTCYGYNNRFIVLDPEDIEKELSINSFPKVYNMLKNIKIERRPLHVYPTFFKMEHILAVKSIQKFVVLEVLETKTKSFLNTYYDTTSNKISFIQNNQDTLKIWMINFNRDETYNILGQLKQEFANSTAPSGVGLASDFRIYSETEYQKGINLKTLLNVLELDVNYNVISSDPLEGASFIKQVLMQITGDFESKLNNL